MIISPYPASAGGAYRDRHGRGRRDAMDAVGATTKRQTRTAKSCGPDPPTLGSSLRVMIPRATVARQPGAPRRSRISRSTIAQGTPVVPAALTLLACAMCTFLCTQGSRVRPASGIPCALLIERVDDRCRARAQLCRENAGVCHAVIASQRVARMRAR